MILEENTFAKREPLREFKNKIKLRRKGIDKLLIVPNFVEEYTKSKLVLIFFFITSYFLYLKLNVLRINYYNVPEDPLVTQIRKNIDEENKMMVQDASIKRQIYQNYLSRGEATSERILMASGEFGTPNVENLFGWYKGDPMDISLANVGGNRANIISQMESEGKGPLDQFILGEDGSNRQRDKFEVDPAIPVRLRHASMVIHHLSEMAFHIYASTPGAKDPSPRILENAQSSTTSDDQKTHQIVQKHFYTLTHGDYVNIFSFFIMCLAFIFISIGNSPQLNVSCLMYLNFLFVIGLFGLQAYLVVINEYDTKILTSSLGFVFCSMFAAFTSDRFSSSNLIFSNFNADRAFIFNEYVFQRLFGRASIFWGMRFGKYSRFSKWFDVKKEFDSGPESDEDSKKSSDKKKKRTDAKWEGQGDKYLSNKLESISEIDDKSQITRPNSRIGSPNVSLNDSMDLSANEG